MPVNEIFPDFQRLRTQVEAFAALGARLSAPDEAFDDDVRAALDEVVDATALTGLEGLTDEERRTVAAMVGAALRQAAAIFEEATDSPGWQHTDPAVLDGQGRASTNIVPHIAAIVGDEPMRSYLDVGTGAGFLAMAIAQRWPDARVVGVDVWEPALERARLHVAEAGLQDRIEIRNQDITTLDDVDQYDYVGIPAMFLPAEVLAAAIQRAVIAAKPRGIVSVAVFRTPADPLRAATERLRVIRDCGTAHTVDSVMALCRKAGLEPEVLNPDAPIPIAFVGGRVT